MKNLPVRLRGFTLIELLTVIAIIGILAALIFPSIGKMRETAQRAVDANNLREIVNAARVYATDNNDRLPDPAVLAAQVPAPLAGGEGPFLWAGILAQRGILTDPNLYFAKSDPSFNGIYPTAIINPGNNGELDPSFVTDRVLAWEFVGGLRMSDPASTPVAFTRGLQTDGTWNAASGVYKGAGGHVAFLGGSIQYFPNTAEAGNQFTLNNGRKGTSVLQALPVANVRVYGTPPSGVGTLNGTAAVAAN